MSSLPLETSPAPASDAVSAVRCAAARPRRRAGVRRPAVLWSSALCALLAGCYSAPELRDRADDDAYALIDARRELLFGDVGPFRLPATTAAFGREAANTGPLTLRDRIVGGLVEEVGPLDVLEALEIAAENSQRVQEEKESLYLSALDLTEEEWRFGYRYTAGASGAISGDVDGDLVSTSSGLGASVTRILGSGATIVGNIGSDLFRFVSTGDGWDAVTNLGLSITQPLLRDSGRLVTLEPLRQTERNLVYAVRDYERFRRTYSVDVASEVYSLLQAIDRLKNEQQNFDNLVLLSRRNAALAEAGQLSEIQVDQARQDELRSKSRLVELQGNLDLSVDRFKVFLGLPLGIELSIEGGILAGLASDASFLDGLDQNVAVDFAIQNRLDVLTSFDRVQDAVRRETIARQALRTGLGLSASVTSDSDEGRPFGHSLDDARFSAALDADLPVDLLPLRNSWRASELTLVDRRRTYERFLDSVSITVRDALRRARNSYQSFEIQQGAVELSERRLEGAQLNLEAGRASTRDVLEAQEDLLQVRNALTSARIAFTLALYDLWLELELLRVDETGIHVDEALAAELRARLSAAQPKSPTFR